MQAFGRLLRPPNQGDRSPRPLIPSSDINRHAPDDKPAKVDRIPLSDDGVRTLPAGNYKRGPDRGAKISEKHPRGFRGGSHGAAGPVIRIDPLIIEVAPPPAVDPQYFAYVRWCREMGIDPKPFPKWRFKLKRRRRINAQSPAVNAHRMQPHKPA